MEASRSSEGQVSRPPVAPTSAVPPSQGMCMEEEEEEDRSITIGLVQPTQSSLILVGHPDVRYQDIFPPEMSFLTKRRHCILILRKIGICCTLLQKQALEE